MDRLKVIRSKATIDFVKNEIKNSQNDIQPFSTMRKTTRTMAASDDDIINEDNINIDENYLENYTSSTASDNPNESTLSVGGDIRADSNYEYGADINLDDYELVSIQSVQESELEFNNPIYSNFVDEVRGNVIKTEIQDSFYIRAPRFGPVKEIERSVLGLDIAKNAIENPFANQDLSEGATISFWVKIPDVYALDFNRGLITFIKDLKAYPHPSRPEPQEVLFQPYISIDCMGTIIYDNAWHNGLYKGADADVVMSNRAVGRIGKNWEHFVITFTNDDIKIYINGAPYDVYLNTNIARSKNFNKPNTETITDMLSSSDTQIFLAITLKNESTFSDAVLYDDIMFYAKAATDDEVKELYEEALTINLP